MAGPVVLGPHGLGPGTATVPRPARVDGIGRIIGPDGALRGSLRTVLDFVFFAAAMAGIILIAAGIWQVIKQMKQREEQREMGRAMWMIGGGAALAIVDVLWVWLAQSIVGQAPNIDPLTGTRYVN